MSLLSQQEYLRYSRHIQLARFGAGGQLRLKQSSALIIGCGGLGAPVALYLAGAGVGHITLVDADSVSISNLHRQICFVESDIGCNKAAALAKRLCALNSDITVTSIEAMLCDANAGALIEAADLVLDCSDRFDVRCLINRYCLASNTSWLYASAAQFSGQFAMFVPGGPCFRCLFPQAPENPVDCNAAGVLGSVPGILGTLQANQALLHLAGDQYNTSSLTLLETAPLQIQSLGFEKRPDCLACGAAVRNPDQNTASTRAKQAQSVLVGEPTNAAGDCHEIPYDQLQVLVQSEPHSKNHVLLLDVRGAEEHLAFNIGGRNIPLPDLRDHLGEIKQQLATHSAQHHSRENLQQQSEQQSQNRSPNEFEQTTVVCYCHSGRR
ncbi:MAG: HesA/MoeB/ThiF family protein, partial [Pseudomonadales bacterium]|nr:HesA/MoeB/ThiF family protein [Pseudomonadales bacterium]